MNIGIAQYDILWESPAENRTKIEALLAAEGEPNLDLLLLPEMFTTGFSMDTKKNAEEMDGETMEWMAHLAAAKNCIISGSLIIKDGGEIYNRLIWMQPDSKYDFYDKRHLFTLAKEDDHFSRGHEKKIFQLEAGGELWRICPQICYDLRFPVFARNEGDYDLLFYVSNFPEKRQFAWSQLLIARAIENQCYLLGVNRTGVDGVDIPYAGGSVILNYEGRTLVDAGSREGIFYANVHKRKLIAYRRAYNFLADRDDFLLTDERI